MADSRPPGAAGFGRGSANDGRGRGPGRVLLLQCRGFGDAVISTGLINAIGDSFPGATVDILGRPDMQPIFAANPHVGRFYAAPFPIAVGLKFTPADALRLLRVILRIRRLRYDLCINLVGDFRENLLGWLSGSAVQLAPVWPARHPILRTIRVSCAGLVDRPQPIDGDACNVYQAYAQIATRLGCADAVSPGIRVDAATADNARRAPGKPLVAIHPFARQDCRRWPGENWRALVEELLRAGNDIVLFGATADLDTAQRWFGDLLVTPGVEAVFGDLLALFARMRAADLFVGLDSFGVHVAHALNVPSLMLNGANDPRIWAPPSSTVVEHPHGCRHYPCCNRPRCIGSGQEYICIRSIPVHVVVDRVRALGARRADGVGDAV